MREEWKAFQSRQRNAARRAHIPGFRTVEDRSSRFDLTSTGNQWTFRLYDGPFYFQPPRRRSSPVIGAVFVQSRDGNTVAENPQTLGGGSTDEHLIFNGLSRVAADAVLAGAKTVLGSQRVFSLWHPQLVALRKKLGKPRHPVQMIATSSGSLNIERELIFNVPSIPVAILTSFAGASKLDPSIKSRPWIHLFAGATWQERLDAAANQMGLHQISLIGGPTLAASLLKDELLTEIYLTTGTVTGGKAGTPWYGSIHPPQMDLVLRKEGLEQDHGVRFEHFLIR